MHPSRFLIFPTMAVALLLTGTALILVSDDCTGPNKLVFSEAANLLTQPQPDSREGGVWGSGREEGSSSLPQTHGPLSCRSRPGNRLYHSTEAGTS
jgi:hypothetical protein